MLKQKSKVLCFRSTAVKTGRPVASVQNWLEDVEEGEKGVIRAVSGKSSTIFAARLSAVRKTKVGCPMPVK